MNRKLKLNFTLAIAVLALIICNSSFAKEIHVAKNGNDFAHGTKTKPLQTINQAARIALPGDTITVHEGIYRERVNPKYGGTSDAKRILYRAAPGEEVYIKGSEIITGWEKVKKGVWKVSLDNAMFKDYNPYKEIINADWFDNKGRVHHTGEVYLNGKSLYEIDSLEKVMAPKQLADTQDPDGSLSQWYCEVSENKTTIYANFHQYNPNKELVEINVRPTVFLPEYTGINYITVRGFHMSQAATNWAPPTALQTGLIGPHWSKGWIIENNEISHSKCSGISLGKERSTGENYRIKYSIKSGHLNQLDVVFKALKNGWNEENIGSHIIRNNSIHDCEQTGICGNLACIFSEIYDNHIYNIFVKRQWDGAEIAGIKLHAPIDVIIKNNCIHNACKGIWIDWQAQGIRVSKNVLYDNTWVDIHIEVTHGPHVIDNNLLLSPYNIWDMASGTAWVHNLFLGKICNNIGTAIGRFTPYHFPHSTMISGIMTTQLGDDHFVNNIFFKGENPPSPHRFDNKRFLPESKGFGLGMYNEFPIKIINRKNVIGGGSKNNLPFHSKNNIYVNGAIPFTLEKGAVEMDKSSFNIHTEEKEDGVYLTIDLKEELDPLPTEIINSYSFGEALHPEVPYEDKKGKYINFDSDLYGKKRLENMNFPGPFNTLKQGVNELKIADF